MIYVINCHLKSFMLCDVTTLMMFFLSVQPHGFFNCSPAVDVPPSLCELEAKEDNNSVGKTIQNGLLSKL